MTNNLVTDYPQVAGKKVEFQLRCAHPPREHEDAFIDIVKRQHMILQVSTSHGSRLERRLRRLQSPPTRAGGFPPRASVRSAVLVRSILYRLHARAIRVDLAQGRNALDLPPVSFSPTASGLRVRTVHVTELSGGVQ